MNPKILVLSISSWNSSVGMNTWPTLLEGNDPDDIAHICLRGEFPDNKACNNYFHISENKVIKSIVKRNIKTGERIDITKRIEKPSSDLAQHNERYRKMKSHRSLITLAAREILWFFGKWKTKELDDFVIGFKPDIILYSMDGYIHFNRLCRYVKKLGNFKSIGFFVDDNFTYRQSSKISDLIFRFFQRRSLFRLARNTDAFWAITDMTKKEADETFGINCTILTKPLSSIPEPIKYEQHSPIRMIYTGNMQIGRDKTLVKLVEALKQFNKDSIQFTIDVYTKTELENDVVNALKCDFCFLHPAVTQSEVIELQKAADILLFLEDIDGPDAKTARLSFSTKITDYFAASKCIIAIANEDTAPMKYFKDNDAALTAVNEEQIISILGAVVDNPFVLEKYARNASELGIKNHSKEKIIKTFNKTIRDTLKIEQ